MRKERKHFIQKTPLSSAPLRSAKLKFARQGIYCESPTFFAHFRSKETHFALGSRVEGNQPRPQIRLQSGERMRDFTLSRHVEEDYLAACAQPLADIALLIPQTGLRIAEALDLAWADVEPDALSGSRFGYIRRRRERLSGWGSTL
jgi:integrase